MANEPRGEGGRPVASTAVSYLLFSGGGAVGGFLLALCAIGNQSWQPHLHSDAAHAGVIGLMTLGGAAAGALAVYRTLGKRRDPDRRG